jgi:hypothetical protein
MKESRRLHEQAMNSLADAYALRKNGEKEEARKVFAIAFEQEKNAAQLEQDGPEPTRSVLYRSAATIAYNYGNLAQAEEMLAIGLSGNPPEDIAIELRDLWGKVNPNRTHLFQRVAYTMKKDTLKEMFASFLVSYPLEEKTVIWQDHSAKFRQFWENRILKHDSPELEDYEIDEVVRILDRNGKGNREGAEAVARAMIAQGAWQRMFVQIKKEQKLSSAIDEILKAKNDGERAKAIDRLYEANKKNKNNLTGQSGNAICAMLAAYDPFNNSCMISLKDRKAFIDYFKLDIPSEYDSRTIGERIVLTNSVILSGLKELGADGDARTLAVFCYSDPMKVLWKPSKDSAVTIDKPPISPKTEVDTEPEVFNSPFLFYMEAQLEDFLIKNWEKTELGAKYDLIEEDGELVSQQYATDIGKIDILVKDKIDGRFVVIELKRDQTSDATVGQLTRYMGWIEENRSKKGETTKGVIIAAQYDPKLYYAVKKVPDVEVFEYRVDFHLERYVKK